jgi:hypothetical protein
MPVPGGLQPPLNPTPNPTPKKDKGKKKATEEDEPELQASDEELGLSNLNPLAEPFVPRPPPFSAADAHAGTSASVQRTSDAEVYDQLF